jgi:hypothetical protein
MLLKRVLNFVTYRPLRPLADQTILYQKKYIPTKRWLYFTPAMAILINNLLTGFYAVNTGILVLVGLGAWYMKRISQLRDAKKAVKLTSNKNFEKFTLEVEMFDILVDFGYVK